MNYGFIGLGNMGQAIIKGMYNSESFDSANIYGYNRSIAKTNNLVKKSNIIATDNI